MKASKIKQLVPLLDQACGVLNAGTAHHVWRCHGMATTDRRKFNARRIVSERLQLFFAQIKQQFDTGTDELWRRVQGKLDRPAEKGSDKHGPTDTT